MDADGLRITTWNVNGIRNPFGYQPWREKKTFPAMFDTLEADIIIMQELKIQRKDLTDDMVLLDGWDCFFSLPKHKKGYSGVGIYTRQSKCVPIRAEEGVLGALYPPDGLTKYCELPNGRSIGGYPSLDQLSDIGIDSTVLDAEGRCVVLEFPAFVLFGVYSPANSNGLRDDFRHGFIKALDARIRNLAALGKRVVLTGDLNISRDERDSAGIEDALKKRGMTHEEYISGPGKRIFNQLVDGGDVVLPRDEERNTPILSDLCREFHPDRKGMYTHWEQKINARPGNYGSRIDYILSSIEIRDWFEEANIQEGLLGSDHCPVYAILKANVILDGKATQLKEIMKPAPSSSPQTVLPTLALSGKLLPEFDRRRNIMDMFTKPKPSPRPGKLASDGSTSPLKNKPHVLETEPPAKRPRITPSPKKPQLTIAQPNIRSFFQPKVNESVSNIAGEEQDNAEQIVEDLSARIAEADVSKTQWTKIFSKRDAPRCEGHDEPCQSLETKKQGPNYGRHFWICARPIGPSGTKENGTQWRCKMFVWASDVSKGEIRI